jgi:hypothetical protein
MDNLKMLEGYRNRMKILSSTYFLSQFVVNRRDCKEFQDHELYNLTVQILCFIMDKSLKGENCLREDIIDFVEELDIVFYKKTLPRERISEIVYYILRKGLRNEGYAYKFSFYDYDSNSESHINVQLVNDNIINVDGDTRTTYFLTEEGYKLLFSTKEYDDIYEIQITKMIAELKIINGDYKSAKEDIHKLINLLEVQCQNLDSYLQRVKKNIFLIQDEKYSEVVEKTFDMLLSQQSKYSELKAMIEDKIHLVYAENINSEQTKSKIEDIKNILEGLDRAIEYIRKLHEKKHKFSQQYKELLKSIMFSTLGGRFDFEKFVMDKIEKDAFLIGNLDKLYKPLFKLQSPNIFSLHTPYGEQNVEKIAQPNKEIEMMIEDVEYESDNDKLIKTYNDFYGEFFKSILDYGRDNSKFFLSGFMSKLKETDEKYIKVTRYGGLIRNLLLFFAHIGGELNLEEVKKELKKIAVVNPSENFDILYTVSSLMKHYKKLPTISVNVLDHRTTFLTSINVEEKTAVKLTVPEIEFIFTMWEE